MLQGISAYKVDNDLFNHIQSATKKRTGTANNASRASGALEADREAPEKSAYSWLEVMFGKLMGSIDTTMVNRHALPCVPLVLTVLGSIA